MEQRLTSLFLRCFPCSFIRRSCDDPIFFWGCTTALVGTKRLETDNVTLFTVGIGDAYQQRLCPALDRVEKEDPLQWIEYRREMLNRYVNAAPQDDLQDSTFKLRRVRLEGKTLVFVFEYCLNKTRLLKWP